MKKTVSILLLIVLFTSLSGAPFRSNSIYSKWAIDSRMGDFRNKNVTERFLTPTTSRNASWDYVTGLVAKAILKAWEQYKSEPWSAYFFTGIEDFADNVSMKLGESNLDDLNAGKHFSNFIEVLWKRGKLLKQKPTKRRLQLVEIL